MVPGRIRRGRAFFETECRPARLPAYTPGMPEYSKHQKKIIERYYDRRDEIMLTRLQELVTELFLADTDAKCDRLWQRVETAMAGLKVPPKLAEHIMTRRDPKILASNLQDWLKSGIQGRQGG